MSLWGRATTHWGPWAFHPTALVLRYQDEETDYAIDLRRCTTSAEVLDWIVQIESKAWGTPPVVGYLVAALCDLLNPQASLCSDGEAWEIDKDDLPSLVLANERGTRWFREHERRGERSKLDRYATEAPPA